jgi:hypothetical protein
MKSSPPPLPPTPPPVPVRALEYDASREVHTWRGVSRGIGVILIVVGGASAVAYGGQLLGDLFGWADPFYRKYRTGTFSVGLPSVALMVTAYAAEAVSGVTGVVCGIVCVARRPWARGFAVAYVVIELVARSCMTTSYVASAGSPGDGPEAWLRYATTGAYALSSRAFPAAVFLLTRFRGLWGEGR